MMPKIQGREFCQDCSAYFKLLGSTPWAKFGNLGITEFGFSCTREKACFDKKYWYFSDHL